MGSCANQAPGRQHVCSSGSGFWPNGWDGAREGSSDVHLLCQYSLENSHSGPLLPISQHFLTPYCIPNPVLGTKGPRNMEKICIPAPRGSQSGGRPDCASKECQIVIQKIDSNAREQPKRCHTAQSYQKNKWFRPYGLVEVREGEML